MASADPSAVDAALLRRMLDESRTVTLLVDASGRVLFASAGLVDVLGVTAEAMLGQNVVDWLHPDDVPRAISSLAINDAATGLRYFPIVFRVLHAQGHAVEVDVLTSLFVLDDGSHGVLLSVRDADDRTHFVEPIRALAAGADHARVLELIASGVGRGGHVLRPAFVATTMDPTSARFTQLHAACADAPLEGALLELLASDDGASLTGLAPRELRSYPVHDMPAAVGRACCAPTVPTACASERSPSTAASRPCCSRSSRRRCGPGVRGCRRCGTTGSSCSTSPPWRSSATARRPCWCTPRPTTG